ncbi:DegT/DnrJ/EryC1/StrS family aminotransferase [Paenibacillus sp. LPE1-1-1.1]|uniref:DegT/DnrJ/EryC1/StrS family aminotransferase n=1 Tax=Paenibacillus sp. LPE1-1-1.1 TaxID=3135230 RepID=UPI00341D18F9
MGIHFSAPQVEFEIIKEKWLQAVQDLAKRGVFVGSPAVNRFEDLFAKYTGVAHTVGVANGTDAIFLALKALGIGPGDEVITAANTFIATVEAIHHTGATPVLVDCDPTTFLLNEEQVKQSVNPNTKAIIAVHLYGQMVDLEHLAAWAGEKGIHVIEDSAQAAGAILRGRRAGSVGIMGCFSFYPEKNLGALGDAGGITVRSDEYATILRKLRNHGGEIRYQHDIPGFNSRLDPIQAIALELKLAYLDEWSAYRREIARMYDSELSQFGSIHIPSNRGDESHVYHLYVIRVTEEFRDELRKELQKKGILTAVQYPVPVHLTPAFSYLGYEVGSFPTAEQYAKEILSLPIHIAMNEESVSAVIHTIRNYMGARQI